MNTDQTLIRIRIVYNMNFQIHRQKIEQTCVVKSKKRNYRKVKCRPWSPHHTVCLKSYVNDNYYRRFDTGSCPCCRETHFTALLVCLDLILYVPVNNLSVTSGWVFLG